MTLAWTWAWGSGICIYAAFNDTYNDAIEIRISTEHMKVLICELRISVLRFLIAEQHRLSCLEANVSGKAIGEQK